MEKNEKRHRKSSRKKEDKLKIACWILATVLLALLTVVVGGYVLRDYYTIPDATSQDGGDSGLKELQITSSVTEGDRVVVSTTYGTLWYSAAFVDQIHVEASNHGTYSQLDFKVVIDGKAELMYTVLFEKNTGIPVGTMKVDGATYLVTAMVHSPEGITEANRLNFYAAQETFNDVMNSLGENDGFVPA